MASLGLVRTIAVAGTHVMSQMEKISAARAKIKVIQPTLQTFARLGQFQRLYQEYHATTALLDIILYQRNDELSIAN